MLSFGMLKAIWRRQFSKISKLSAQHTATHKTTGHFHTHPKYSYHIGWENDENNNVNDWKGIQIYIYYSYENSISINFSLFVCVCIRILSLLSQ